MTYRHNDELPELKPYELNVKDASIMGRNATNAIQTLVNVLQSNGSITSEEADTVRAEFERESLL